MSGRPADHARSTEVFDAFLEVGSMVKGGRVAVSWLPDGRMWFVEGAPHDSMVKAIDPSTKTVETLFDVKKVREGLHAHLDRPLPYSGLPFDQFLLLGDTLSFSFEGLSYRMSLVDYSVHDEPTPNQMEQIFGRSPAAMASPRMFVRPSYHSEGFAVPEMPSPDGGRLVGLEDHNLVLHYTVDGRTESLTDDGVALYGWDVESIRMGMAAGGSIVQRTTSPWSPDGLLIFATKFDQRKVTVQTRTHLLKRHDEVESVRVARTGDPLPIIEPYVVDVLKRKTVRIDIETEDHLLLFLGWRSDSRSLSIMTFSRDMQVARLFAVDAATGQATLVHEERGDTYVRIQHQVVWGRAGCTLLADGSGFLWESEADGWNHLYLHDADGGLVRQLTSGDWPVLDVLAVDLEGRHVYFTSHCDQARPYDVHFSRVSLDGGEPQRLTPDAGVHDIQLAPDHRSFVATRSTPDLPPRSEARQIDGTLLHAFPPADISKLEALGWTPPEQFSVKAADGVTDLWGVIFKPVNFDPSARYPVIEYIYGGPQIVNVPHNFHAPTRSPYYAMHCALPQLGYVVVLLDARGTPERSKAFQDTSYKEWRRHVGNDHASAIRALGADRPWMDLDRVGIWGHSWGGYHTLACMLDHPEVYKVGVSSAPGYDAYDYFIYEPYFGGPPNPDNISAYEDSSLFKDVHSLKGHLMIVAGSSDICPWQNAMKMTNALIRAGISHEFVALPDEVHGYGAKHEAYFIGKLADHFATYL